MSEIQYKWKERKRTIFGLPWSFTVYRLTEEKLLLETGFLNKKEDEIRLYRIMDVTLKRSLEERFWGLGTIHCCSADKSSPEFEIKRIKQSSQVKEMLSHMVEEQRASKRVTSREFMQAEAEMDCDEGI